MKRASFFGAAFLSGVAVGAGLVGGVLGFLKLSAAYRDDFPANEPSEPPEPIPQKKPRASKRGKSGAPAPRKTSEPDLHRAKSWKN